MKFNAHVQNSEGQHQVTLRTNENAHSIVIPPKSTGLGSSRERWRVETPVLLSAVEAVAV